MRLCLFSADGRPRSCQLDALHAASVSGCFDVSQSFSAGLPAFAVDLLPSRVKFQIFVDMPWRIRLATIAAPLKVWRAFAACAIF